MIIYVFKTSIEKMPQKIYNKIATSIDEIANDHISTSSTTKRDLIQKVLEENKIKFEYWTQEQ